MEYAELKEKLVAAFKAREEQFNQIKVLEEKLIDDVMNDCREVVAQIPTFKEFGGLVIEAADDMTNTGLMDPFDQIVGKYIFSKYIDTPKAEQRYADIRSKVLAAIGNTDSSKETA